MVKIINKKIVFWFIGLIILILFVINLDVEELRISIKEIDVLTLIILLVLQLITLGLTSYQWYYLLIIKEKKVSYFKVLIIYLTGSLVESITPSSKLGGEGSKLILLKQETSLSNQDLTAILLLQKIISLLPFILLCSIVLFLAFFRYSLPHFIYYAFLSFLVFTFIFYIFYQRLRQEKEKAKFNVNNYFLKYVMNLKSKVIIFLKKAVANSQEILDPRQRYYLVFLSFLIWILYPLKLFLVAQMLNLEIELIFMFVVTYLAYLISLIPLAPGGLGTFEGTIAILFSLNGFLLTEGMLVAIIARLITYWFPLLLSLISAVYMLFLQKKRVIGEDLKLSEKIIK